MTEKMNMMLLETDDGAVSVELYKDGPKALEAFTNLNGRPGDAPSRASFLILDFTKGEVTTFETKNLPIIKDPDDEPWGHRLGVGPIEKPEKSSEESGN